MFVFLIYILSFVGLNQQSQTDSLSDSCPEIKYLDEKTFKGHFRSFWDCSKPDCAGGFKSKENYPSRLCDKNMNLLKDYNTPAVDIGGQLQHV